MNELIFVKLDVFIMAPESISTACFVYSSHQTACKLPAVAGKRLGKNITAESNTQETIE
jgi:hypothetical protein